MTGAECQDICKHVANAKQFSHYNEGHHAEHGFCGCFSQCWPVTAGCHDKCATHEVVSYEAVSGEDLGDEEDEEDLESSETFGGEVDVEREKEPRPGPRYCHCMHGPMTPDADSCDFP